MRRKSLVLGACFLLGIGCLTGCTKYKLVKVDEATTQAVTEAQTTQAQTTQVQTTESMSTEAQMTTQEVTLAQQGEAENTQESSTEATSSGVMTDADYIGISGCAFNCSEPLTCTSDESTFADYTWNRESGVFTVNTEVSSFSFEDEVEVVKDSYSDGTVLQDEYTKTLYNDFDAYVRVVQEGDYCTALGVVDIGSKTIRIKVYFDATEECLKLATEVLGSFGYFRN